MIDPQRLYVTYFGGDESNGLAPDTECRDIWRSIGVADDHILPFGCHDNFWEMGLSGPCGPSTEIHIDHLPFGGSAEKRAKFVNAGTSDLTELWNIVFIEYNRNIDGILQPLHEKYIDTGMGFERLVAVLQGKMSNYDTDLFTPIFDAIHKESKMRPYSGIFDAADSRYDLDYAYRVVADHARMCSVCIADGMYPQTNYRLRKILRRTMNICETVFKNENLIQTAILPEIVKTLGPVYPELTKNLKNIRETITYENEHNKTIRLRNQKEFKSLNISPKSDISEEDTIDCSEFSAGYRDVEKFLELNSSIMSLPNDFLYDKLHARGIPDKLIEKIAYEKDIMVDMDNFAQYKQQKKFEAKMSLKNVNKSFLDSIVTANVPKTDYSYMYDYSFDSNAKQYNVKPITANIQLIQCGEENRYHIVLDRTNFYHTAGGQDGDIGKMIDSNGNIFIVNGVVVQKGCVIHSGYFENSSSDPFKQNQNVKLFVDSSNRTSLSQHHTAMHLLQAAMKNVTGQIIFQQSSHITCKELKCDLGSIGQRIDLKQLTQIETIIQNVIEAKVSIETRFLMAHDLYAMDNVTILPGEIYPDENVRILTVNDPITNFISIEPCCGTHAQNTSDLIDFCITSFKFGSNSYNVTAVAGQSVKSFKENGQRFLNKFELLKSRLNDTNSLDESKCIEIDAKELSKELTEQPMPYVIKTKAMTEMKKFVKNIAQSQKDQWRKIITTEMVDILNKRDQNKDTFIIHVLNTKDGLDDSLFDDAEQVCHDFPLILLNVSNNKIIHGRACIPTKYTTNKFNVQHWMQEIGRTLNIECQTNKKKKPLEKCCFVNVPDKEFSPNILSKALEKATIRAEQAFNTVVSADQNERKILEDNLIASIDGLIAKLNNANSVGRIIEIETEVKNIKDHMKNNLFNYLIQRKCTAELVDISIKLCEARKEIELNFLNAELNDSSKKQLPYIVCTINTEHRLVSMMYSTDLNADIPNVLINITNDQVIGRISIPLKNLSDPFYFRAKHLADVFIEQFGGKCIHDSTRYDASVCDFSLNVKSVNSEQLNNMFKKVEQMLKEILDA
ncbi:alanine--tRNA ligase, mitochondrial isoform X2 [Contarinia nasturtii]|nr:alanine--tRNA ligase, mitochondrial isoform X2 [Contarinia nasturtii]